MVAVNIARECDRNIRRAILMLEALHVQIRNNTIDNNNNTDEENNDNNTIDGIQTTDWQLYIRRLADDIINMTDQPPTIEKLLTVREKLYKLLEHCIPPSVVLKTLFQHFLPNIMTTDDDDDDNSIMKCQVVEWAAFYEHRLITGGKKEIVHLEAFIGKFMAFLYMERQ